MDNFTTNLPLRMWHFFTSNYAVLTICCVRVQDAYKLAGSSDSAVYLGDNYNRVGEYFVECQELHGPEFTKWPLCYFELVDLKEKVA
jgi:hypothetical protein